MYLLLIRRLIVTSYLPPPSDLRPATRHPPHPTPETSDMQRLGLLFAALFDLTATALTTSNVARWRQSYVTRLRSYNLQNIHAELMSNYEDKSKTMHDFELYSYESSLRALKAYYEIHGDLVIPRSFEVPATKGKCCYCMM